MPHNLKTEIQSQYTKWLWNCLEQNMLQESRGGLFNPFSCLCKRKASESSLPFFSLVQFFIVPFSWSCSCNRSHEGLSLDWCIYITLVLYMVQCVVQARLLQPLLGSNRAFEERSLDLDPLGWLITADLLQREWGILSQEQCVNWSPLLWVPFRLKGSHLDGGQQVQWVHVLV